MNMYRQVLPLIFLFYRDARSDDSSDNDHPDQLHSELTSSGRLHQSAGCMDVRMSGVRGRDFFGIHNRHCCLPPGGAEAGWAEGQRRNETAK